MADAYAARPAYPNTLVARLSGLAGTGRAHIVDIGAGIGHLSLPLAALGHRLSAIEPAHVMLQTLQARARAAGHTIHTLHAAAESLPLPDASVDLAVIADALHFLDAHRAGSELARVLRPRAALALLHVEFGASPFMRALLSLMHECAPRRPKRVMGTRMQLAALSQVNLSLHETIEHVVPVEIAQLERILCSISFIGPAMNDARFEAFRTRLHAIEHTPVWHTRLQLWAGRRTAG